MLTKNARSLLLFPLLVTACDEAALTWAETGDALEMATYASAAGSLTGEIVEITTDFTLGQAAADAAAELASFLESQVACSTVTLEGASVTIDFGTLDDVCVYAGRTYAGVVEIAIVRAEPGEVHVEHTWTGLTNGVVTLDGGAQVRWGTGFREVVHEAEWRFADGTELTGRGHVTQSLLDESLGLGGGIVVDGERSWETARGTWTLEIDSVEARGQDPVPQAGTYTLTLPSDKVAELTFERLDVDTIEVVLTGGLFTRTWHVTAAGVTEA